MNVIFSFFSFRRHDLGNLFIVHKTLLAAAGFLNLYYFFGTSVLPKKVQDVLLFLADFELDLTPQNFVPKRTPLDAMQCLARTSRQIILNVRSIEP